MTEQDQNPYPGYYSSMGFMLFSPTCGTTNTVGGPAACPPGNPGRINPALGSFTVGENGSHFPLRFAAGDPELAD